MRTAAVVPAAGRGERLGPGTPKALREVGGVPMLVHAVRTLARARFVDVVVVAAPPGEVAAVAALLADHEVPAEVRIVAGGASRQESVLLAVASLPPDVTAVLVHDAARPLVPVELVDAVATAVREGAEAVVPALPVADTVKVVDPDAGFVVATPDRATLRAIQTPQGFRREVLEAAHAAAGAAVATDDAGLVEALGIKVSVVPGSEEAFKVTRPIDLMLAEALFARRYADGVR
jgi:2-C-methyl-D-erythritol 4-phosphate cytidylyltransferase